MEEKKIKKVFYKVNPLFFRDGNKDGFGDFDGFLETIPYIKLLGINCVIFPDIFNNKNSLSLPTYVSLEEKYGGLEKLSTIVSELKKENISFAFEINIKDIFESILIKKARNKLSIEKDKKDFYLDKAIGNNRYLEWDKEGNIFFLRKIAGSLKKLNIENLIITNFENMFSRNEYIGSQTIELLIMICNILKKEFSFSEVFLKSNHFSNKQIQNIMETNLVDLFIDTSLNDFGISKNIYGYEKVEKFKSKKFFNKLSSLFNEKDSRELSMIGVSLSENKNGRIISRWGSTGILRNDSAKAFLSIILFLPTKTILYFGDELGLLNLELKDFNDLNDPYIWDKKRHLESKGIREKDFWNSTKTISSINNNHYFPWNNSPTLGFTEGKIQQHAWKLYPFGFGQNVKEQIKNVNSSLNFVKKTTDFLKEKKISDFLDNYDFFEIKNHNGLIKYLYKKNNQILTININLENKWIKLKNEKNKEIIYCSNHKRREKNVSFIMPYEVLVDLNIL